ncbi:hypothetical protein J6590_066002 [Homalodisca vitripennis]|nr:hypothetical protein J6590_066002 [Homalodisca vitripennis]
MRPQPLTLPIHNTLSLRKQVNDKETRLLSQWHQWRGGGIFFEQDSRLQDLFVIMTSSLVLLRSMRMSRLPPFQIPLIGTSEIRLDHRWNLEFSTFRAVISSHHTLHHCAAELYLTLPLRHIDKRCNRMFSLDRPGPVLSETCLNKSVLVQPNAPHSIIN